MSERIKGFIFGAFLMLMSPALALQGEPRSETLHDVFAPDAVTSESVEPVQYFRLTYADAEEAIAQALVDRGAGSKIAANITSGGGEYVFSYSQPISVEIRGLRFEPATHRFSANLVSVSGKEVISAKAISGRFDEMVEVPVLKRSVRAGEVIRAEDLELRDYTEARARVDTVTDMASLIGKSPVRVISAGRPVRVQELGQPTVVKKNDRVQMLFRRDGMQISTQGQVLDDAAHGAMVNVRNLASKKIVQARVLDASTVLIDQSETQASLVSAGDVYAN